MSISVNRQSASRFENQDTTDGLSAPLKYYRHLRRLEQYVDHNITSSFQLADIALDIGVSSSRLSHLFVEKTGVSYSDWIREKRVSLAADLLLSDDSTVLNIAMSVGYSNVRSFERAFKKSTGLTPTQYRRSTTSQ